MAQRTLMKPRILLIEDESDIRSEALRYLQRIPRETRQQYGIGDFEIEEADSAAKAEQLLKEAKTLSHPYDLVLLDLHLPKNRPGDGTESLSNGQGLLNFIKESQTAGGVIIVSAFDDYQTVVTSFRGGALDFVAKTFYQETLQPPVLNALARLMAEESNRALNQRIRDLVTYADRGLAHSFKVVFSTLAQRITEAADGIEEYVRERYGLEMEKDPHDALMRNLRAHQKAITQARRDWAKLQSEMARGGETPTVDCVEEMLRGLKESLMPCLVVKKVTFNPPDSTEMTVLTFEKDVYAVLREIIVGMLNELPDYGKERRIKVDVTTNDTRAEVRFEDDLDPIPEQAMTAINEGQRIIPDANFRRVWGLSVAQHVALRGGGELIVKTERGRNIVTYRIPLADYA